MAFRVLMTWKFQKGISREGLMSLFGAKALIKGKLPGIIHIVGGKTVMEKWIEVIQHLKVLSLQCDY